MKVRARAVLRDQLLNEMDDENASEDDNEYQQLFEGDNNPAVQSRLQDILNADDANEILRGQVNVTQAEIFLGVLKYALVYKLPQSAIADLFRMLNIFLSTTVLPESRYLVDKIFNFEDNVDYYALCPTCKRFITQFNREEDNGAFCEQCDLQFSFKDPTYRDFFCIMNPENEIAHYMEENWTYFESIVDARARNTEHINGFHDGLFYKRLRNSLPDDRKDNFITATFNSDGSPVFESSAFSVWPIQIMINELPFKQMTSKTIVCGLWFGRNKPDMNVFLEPFVTQMNIFTDRGITCNVRGIPRTLYVYAICSCDDSVARAPMQGITQFNGYFGCSWCLHPGYYVHVGRGGSMKYILLDDPVNDRNPNDTLRDAREAAESGHPVNGVLFESILHRLMFFNIVFGFIPDAMHCIDLGIAKQFLKLWLETSGMPYSLTKAEIDFIDNILKKITVPSKLMRNSRSIRDRKFWKAKELQNWILYYSTIVLFMIPRMRVYAEHWSYLVRAYHILLQNNITREQVQEANRLLHTFVALTEFYYSKSAMTYNVHQLLHTAQTVINWGPLHYHSGYGFENGNGNIVSMVKAAKGVIYQIVRNIGMKKSDWVLQKFMIENKPDSAICNYIRYLESRESTKVFTTNIGRYFGTNSRPKPRWVRQLDLSDSALVYKKLVKTECTFLSCDLIRLRSNNSFAITHDNVLIQIVFFIVDIVNEHEYTICKRVRVTDIIENDDHFRAFKTKRIDAISRDMIAIDTHTLDKVCVYMNCDNERYLCPVSNIFSY